MKSYNCEWNIKLALAKPEFDVSLMPLYGRKYQYSKVYCINHIGQPLVD